MYTTNDGQIVACLTSLPDGEFDLRLTKKQDGAGNRSERTVRLFEPTGRQYARLRTKMVDVDREVREKYPRPDEPVGVDEMGDYEKAQAELKFAEALTEWSRDWNDYLRSEETAPYANLVIEVVKELNGDTITLDDIVPECFKSVVCLALLESWDSPLGGLDALPGIQTPGEAMADRDDDEPQAAPDSTVPTRSSPPGTEPSPLSPQLP